MSAIWTEVLNEISYLSDDRRPNEAHTIHMIFSVFFVTSYRSLFADGKWCRRLYLRLRCDTVEIGCKRDSFPKKPFGLQMQTQLSVVIVGDNFQHCYFTSFFFCTAHPWHGVIRSAQIDSNKSFCEIHNLLNASAGHKSTWSSLFLSRSLFDGNKLSRAEPDIWCKSDFRQIFLPSFRCRTRTSCTLIVYMSTIGCGSTVSVFGESYILCARAFLTKIHPVLGSMAVPYDAVTSVPFLFEETWHLMSVYCGPKQRVDVVRLQPVRAKNNKTNAEWQVWPNTVRIRHTLASWHLTEKSKRFTFGQC